MHQGVSKKEMVQGGKEASRRELLPVPSRHYRFIYQPKYWNVFECANKYMAEVTAQEKLSRSYLADVDTDNLAHIWDYI